VSGLDIAANRKARKWSVSELIARALWEGLSGPLFSWTPRPFWAWRRVILRTFGARVGSHVHFHPSVRVAVPWNVAVDDNSSIGDCAILYSLGMISIGRDVTISQYAHICAGTHDHKRPDMPLVKAPIHIGDGAWVCADAFVGPGTVIGAMSVVGARAVVMSDVLPNQIVVGNPAKVVGDRRMLKYE